MTMLLGPCPSCQCLIKENEAACPFCGAMTPRPAVRGAGAPRMSRAAWAALASSAVVGGLAATAACSSTSPSSDVAAEAGDDGSSPEAEADAAPDLDADAAAHHDAEAGLHHDGSAHHTFPCGDASCSLATQYCSKGSAAPPCTPTGAPDYACYTRDGDSGYPPQCLDAASCACVAQYLPASNPWESYSCADAVDGGGVVIWVASSCNPCYGAPPARLERLASPRRIA